MSDITCHKCGKTIPSSKKYSKHDKDFCSMECLKVWTEENVPKEKKEEEKPRNQNLMGWGSLAY